NHRPPRRGRRRSWAARVRSSHAASAARETRDERATRSRRSDVAEHARAPSAGGGRQVARRPEQREKTEEGEHQSLLGFTVEKQGLERHHGSRGHAGREELDQAWIARAAAGSIRRVTASTTATPGPVSNARAPPVTPRRGAKVTFAMPPMFSSRRPHSG